MDRLLALQASAGSGKTYALTVRYLSLLFLGAKPSSIIALTFTKKAANEMKERIFQTLINLQNQSELDQISNSTNLTKEQIINKKDIIIKEFLNSTLHVETIDAFFGKILRKFSLHLGVMPDFLTTDETHQGKLKELFIKEAFRDKNAFNSLVNFMLSEQKKLSNVFDFFVLLYEKSKELNINNQTDSSQKYQTLPTKLNSEQEILLKANEIRDYLQKKGASKTAVNMFDVNSIEELISKGFWDKQSLNYRTFAKVYEESLDELYYQLKELYKSYCLQKEAYILGELFSLFKLYEKTKFELSKQLNELTFSDVTFLVFKLLHEGISNEFLYFRLDGEIEHLLIDEFQDTNVVQFDILSPIVDEINSGIGVKENKTFFYVGDTKQSIYRFRGGVKELFDEVAKKFHVKVNSLDTNYRSKGYLVEYVNEIFAPIFPKYIPQKVKIGNENQGYLEVKTSDNLLEDLCKYLEILFNNGANSDDIAILCHTNSDAQSVKEYITNYNKSLHVSIESTKPLINSKQVKALIEFLKYSYFDIRLSEKNTLVLLGRSFDEELHVKIENFDKPLEVLLIEAIGLLDIDGTDEDILYFIEIAKDYENIETLLFEIDRLNASSQTSEDLGIKALTIHKSKGLEFKHVIVLDKLGKKNYQSGTFLFEYEKERLQNIFVRMKNREHVDSRYKNAKQKDKILDEIDTKNAMYVAFTRAENSLIILQKEKNSSLDFLNLNDFQKGKIIPSLDKPKPKSIHVFPPLPSYGAQKSLHVEDENEYHIKAIYFGLAFHYLMELTHEFTTKALNRANISVKNRFGDFIDTNEVLKRGINLINNEKFISLTKGGIFHKEQPLIYKVERKQLDLLVQFDSKYIIIDYKTSEHIHNEHIKQVKNYKKALEFLKSQKIEAWLFYARENEIKAINI